MASVPTLAAAAAAAARRRLASSASASASVACRSFGTIRSESSEVMNEPIPPGHTIDAVPPPPGWKSPTPSEPDPMAYVRKPVTSAHAVDLSADPPRLSARDSAALSPNGTVVHGRYGELGADVAKGVPLEYLALLRHAAEGAAAVRTVSSGGKGTVLVYGATRPAGMSAVQLASASGHAVVAVVDGQHSGDDEMVDIIKGLASEPGTAVPEEYALVKANFRDLVRLTSAGDDPSSWGPYDTESFLSDFRTNLLEYVAAYPDDLPAAVGIDHLEFKGKPKDRENFRVNLDAYLSQFPPGAAPIDPAKLDAYFTSEQYELFKKKFGIQATAVVSGGDGKTDTDHFAPAEIVSKMIESPEHADKSSGSSPDDVPYEFSILRRGPTLTPATKGGPIVGAIVHATPELIAAAEAVSKAKTLRSKAEALQCLTEGQKNAHAAASAVVAVARESNTPVVVVGGTIPGLDDLTIEPTDDDVRTALDGMELGSADDGASAKINYFLQIYRAGDFPVYADYALHRATEELAGPRQIVVTK